MSNTLCARLSTFFQTNNSLKLGIIVSPVAKSKQRLFVSVLVIRVRQSRVREPCSVSVYFVSVIRQRSLMSLTS
jgi:hypothetical protein